MSLSFVTKAIQTTTADGVFEEQPVASSDGDSNNNNSSNNGYGSVSLSEQLRVNREQEDAEREEAQRSLMRGTLALDDEDAAHLEQWQTQKQNALAAQRHDTESQLATFRAAQAERQIGTFTNAATGSPEDEPFKLVEGNYDLHPQTSPSINATDSERMADHEISGDSMGIAATTTRSSSKPQPFVKVCKVVKIKRRRVVVPSAQNASLHVPTPESNRPCDNIQDIVGNTPVESSSLLAGYGSDSSGE